jgi:glucose-6-phosphate 1-epimerase
MLSDDAKSKWPYEFGLVYSVTLSREGLGTSLQVRNQGSENFEFQVLLHTYLAIEVCVFLHPSMPTAFARIGSIFSIRDSVANK